MRAFILGTTIVLVLTAGATAQIDFSDNFDDGNIDDWNLVDVIGFATGEPHAEISVVDGTVRINAPPVPSPELAPAAAAIDRLGSLHFTDFEISVDVVENNSGVDGFSGIAGRVHAPFVGYGFSFAEVQGDIAPGNHVVSIARGDPGVPATVLAEVFLDDLPRDNVRLVFRGEGSTLSGELVSLSDLSTPLVSLTAEDTTYTEGGNGIFVFGGSPAPPNPPNFASFGNARFDNNSLIAVPEPWSLVMIAPCLLSLLLRRSRKLFLN